MHRCSVCGRFTKQVRDAIGLPLLTGFPPDRPCFASSVPYAPFVCYNHPIEGLDFGKVEYQQVGFAVEN